MHCADDICLAQELVRDELPRPDSNSECDATGGNCGGLGQAPHVANFPLRRCCFQVVHTVFRMTSVFRSDSGIGNVEVLQKRQWVAHDVTVVHVPLIREALRFSAGACCGSRAPVCFSGPASWKFADSCNLAAWSACSRCSSAESFTPIQGRVSAACRAAMLPRQAALQGDVNVSLLCTTILGNWREPFLFNMRRVSMFPCCCRVLGEKTRRRLAHCLPFDHPKAVFLVDFDSGQRSTE